MLLECVCCPHICVRVRKTWKSRGVVKALIDRRLMWFVINIECEKEVNCADNGRKTVWFQCVNMAFHGLKVVV